MRKILVGAVACAGLAVLSAAAGRCLEAAADAGRPGTSPGSAPASVRARHGYGSFPLLFAENRGQTDRRAAFHAWGRERSVFLRNDGLTFSLRDRAAGKGWSLSMDFVGARPGMHPEGLDRAETRVSWFKGPPSAWKTGVPTWSSVVYRELWPGVDLVCSGVAGAMKYEFRVAPGADPAGIRLAWRGASSVAVDAEGRLVVATPAGEIRDERPVSWQEIDGERTDVPTSYEPGPAAKDGSRAVGFRLGAYDRTRPLVVDPAILVYCGYLGDGVDEGNSGIAVDGSGNAYVASRTYSTETTYPVSVGPDLTQNGDADAVVAKINPSGTGLVYCGFIGGSGFDEAKAIAVDAFGAAYVTGQTQSSEATFPVTDDFDSTFNGGTDAFVAKVNSSGSTLTYCSYIGGAGVDVGTGIAVGSLGQAFIVGTTTSDETTFPIVGGLDPTYNGGAHDAFVAEVSASGGSLNACGYIGGAGDDLGTGIALTGSAAVVIVGTTSSTEGTFPVTVGPDLTFNGSTDVFVAKVNEGLGSLAYCGYIGGTFAESSPSVAVDGSGAAYVAGATYSSGADFPKIVGPSLINNGGRDAFVAKVHPGGASLDYCGFIGGSAYDGAYAIAVDGSGRAWVAGSAGFTGVNEGSRDPGKPPLADFGPSLPFPVISGPDLTENGSDDGFVARVLPDGSGLDISGYIGGSSSDYCTGIAVDPAGMAYVTGYTFNDETSFPVTVGPSVTKSGSGSVTFVAKIDPNGVPPPPAIQSFFLPKKVIAKFNAKDVTKDSLVAVGFLDTGPAADPGFTGLGMLDIGDLQVGIPGLTPDAKGLKFSYKGQGLAFQVIESRAGSSRAKFKLKYLGDLTGHVATDADLTLTFNNGTVNGAGEVGLTGPAYTLGRKRGELITPNVFLYKAKATLKGAGSDLLSLKAGLATGGETPSQAPAVKVGFGPVFSTTIASNQFVPKGDRFEFHGNQGGVTLVILDYLRETITVSGRGLDLGSYAGGSAVVTVTVGLDADVRAVQVRMGHKGKVLVY